MNDAFSIAHRWNGMSGLPSYTIHWNINDSGTLMMKRERDGAIQKTRPILYSHLKLSREESREESRIFGINYQCQ